MADARAILVIVASGVASAIALAAPPANKVAFTDVTAQAGIKFVHNAGKTGKKYLPETLGSGAAFFDADGDGWIDILLVNSKDWTPRGRRTHRRALSQQPQRDLHRHHAGQRPRCGDVRHRRGRRRLR